MIDEHRRDRRGGGRAVQDNGTGEAATRQQRPGAELVADLLLGATSAGVVHHLRRERGIELERIQAAARALLHGLIGDACYGSSPRNF